MGEEGKRAGDTDLNESLRLIHTLRHVRPTFTDGKFTPALTVAGIIIDLKKFLKKVT